MSARKLRFLIVDDHAVIRLGIEQALRLEFDAEFTHAGNAREAIERIQAQPFDLTLLDITMPGRSGVDAIVDLKNAQPAMPILVVSMHGEEQYATRVLRAGGSGYITKSQLTDELVAAVRKVLAGRTYISEALGERLAAGLSSARKPGHEGLSAREFEVLRMIASGRSGKEIAADLSISYKTVSTYRTRVLEKLNLRTNLELAEYVRRERLSEVSHVEL